MSLGVIVSTTAAAKPSSLHPMSLGVTVTTTAPKGMAATTLNNPESYFLFSKKKKKLGCS
jgi:hypothetical protein